MDDVFLVARRSRTASIHATPLGGSNFEITIAHLREPPPQQGRAVVERHSVRGSRVSLPITPKAHVQQNKMNAAPMERSAPRRRTTFGNEE